MAKLDIVRTFTRNNKSVHCCECRLPANGFLKVTKQIDLEEAHELFGIKNESDNLKINSIYFYCCVHMTGAISLFKHCGDDLAISVWGLELYNTKGELLNIH